VRQVVASRTGVTVTEVAVPEPDRNEVRIRTRLVGVCGSDVHAAAGRHPFVPLPYRPGHEVVGVVDALGADVDSIRVGDRATVEPDLPCWSCKMCSSGRENLCENLQFFGCGWRQGGMSDLFTIPANRLHVVPDDFDDQAAVLIEPLSTPVHAARLAGDLAGRSVAILGAGTIALLLLAVVREAGARTIVVTDVVPDKRERALEFGADAAVDPGSSDATAQIRSSLGESADVVFDCVAVQSTISQAVELASKGGTVVVVGVPIRDVTVPLAIVQDHQIRIQGSATYLPVDYQKSIELLRGAINAGDIISAVYDVADCEQAFAAAASGRETKVVVSFAEPSQASV
jgi:2-desacetyl-2-hydroxyethyl bacteriochlorophyllide A dehydrogenase